MHSIIARLRASALLVVLALCGAVAPPAWALPDDRISSEAFLASVNWDNRAHVASNAGGDFVVVYQGKSTTNCCDDIRAQLFRANGGAVTGEFMVSQPTTQSDQRVGNVVMDAAGNFVIVWQRMGPDLQVPANRADVYWRRFDANGNALMAEARVSAVTAESQYAPDIAMDRAGNFVVVWTDSARQGNGFSSIWAQRFNASAVRVGGEFKVTVATTGSNDNAKAAYDPGTGYFSVVWDRYVDSTTGWDVYGRSFDASGAGGSEVQVNDTLTAGSQFNSGLVMINSSCPVWLVRSDGATTDAGTLYWRRCGTSLAPLSSTAGTARGAASISRDSSANYVIAWQSKGEDSAGYGIRARRFNSLHTPLSSEFTVNTTTAHDQLQPAVTLDADGDYVIVWNDNDPGVASRFAAQRLQGAENVDLLVSVVDTPDPVVAGGTYGYAVSVKNQHASSSIAGVGLATGVVGGVNLPDGTAFTSLSAAGWACAGPDPMYCYLNGPLAPGATASFTVNVQSQSATSCRYLAPVAVFGDQYDAAGANNSVQETTRISNSGFPIGALRFSQATASVSEGAGSAVLTVNRSGGDCGQVGVSYASANGSALAGSDYTAVTGALNWADGDTAAKTISVPITNDTVGETTETLSVGLSAPTGGAALGANAAETVSIIDNDPALSFSASAYAVGESAGSAIIAVHRSGPVSAAASVKYATANGTALTSQPDYTAASGTLSWAAGDGADKTFSVPITTDSKDEADETVTLTLSAATGAQLIAPATATLTITDDDSQMRFAAASYTVDEAGKHITVVVKRLGGSVGAASVKYATANGSALAGLDYTASSATLSWADGDAANKQVVIAITNDVLPESAETFNVVLSTPTGGELVSPSTTVVTIPAND